jgi:hypothetical protein
MPQAPLPATQIGHPHNLHYQTRPPGEMLGPLPLDSFGVVLLPCKTCFLPRFKNCFDEVEAQALWSVQRFVLVGAEGLCVFLKMGY